ncbi:MAG: ankyrin repeat domain-containing protein [Rickettsiaceae bacterium]|nr:MAG: ankyrin repeat domain-containing protein [Rickettsiaceae bacterium]
MSKINKSVVLDYQQQIVNSQPLLIQKLISCIFSENEKAYNIIANQISLADKYYTSVSDLVEHKCFFAPNFGQKIMKMHFEKFPLKLGSNKDHANLMNEAIAYGANYFISYLLSQGISPDIYDKLGQYPIAIATLHNNIEVVKMFIEHGANVNSYRKGHVPAIGIAKAIEARDITLILKKAGALDGRSPTKFTIPKTLVPYNDGSIDKDILQLEVFLMQAVFASENQDLFFQMTYKMFEKITNTLAPIPTDQYQQLPLSKIIDSGTIILKMY